VTFSGRGWLLVGSSCTDVIPGDAVRADVVDVAVCGADVVGVTDWLSSAVTPDPPLRSHSVPRGGRCGRQERLHASDPAGGCRRLNLVPVDPSAARSSRMTAALGTGLVHELNVAFDAG
jgi:hypothetical protein